MTQIRSVADPDYVNKQYQNSANLNARIRLHQKCSTNPYGWWRWLFDHFNFIAPCRVLELGSGPGDLWLENLDRIPTGVDITISDLSAGMLEQAQQHLQNSRSQFQFRVIDAQSIPYEDACFDVVIASHMLYHVPDRMKAIQEIRRVLKPGGSFYASTNGSHNLIELGDLLGRFDPQLSGWHSALCDTFLLDNGAKQLKEFFSEVTLFHYSDSLMVTDAKLLADYVLSGRIELPPEQQADLVRFFEQEIRAGGEKIHITKDSGVFQASGIRIVD